MVSSRSLEPCYVIPRKNIFNVFCSMRQVVGTFLPVIIPRGNMRSKSNFLDCLGTFSLILVIFSWFGLYFLHFGGFFDGCLYYSLNFMFLLDFELIYRTF